MVVPDSLTSVSALQFQLRPKKYNGQLYWMQRGTVWASQVQRLEISEEAWAVRRGPEMPGLSRQLWYHEFACGFSAGRVMLQLWYNRMEDQTTEILIINTVNWYSSYFKWKVPPKVLRSPLYLVHVYKGWEIMWSVQGISDSFCHAVSPRAEENTQPQTVFLTSCQTQSTAAENTKLLHVGCPSSHLQHVFIYVFNICNANASVFQVMLYLDKTPEHSSEGNPHSEVAYHQRGFLLLKWDMVCSPSQCPAVHSLFTSPSRIIKEFHLPWVTHVQRQLFRNQTANHPA